MASSPMFLGLAIERFCSVVFPIRHRTQLTTRVCWYFICALWVMHGIFEVLVTSLFLPMENIKFDSVSAVYFMVFFLIAQSLYMATFVSLKKQRKRTINRQDSNTVSRTIIARIATEKQFVRTIAIRFVLFQDFLNYPH